MKGKKSIVRLLSLVSYIGGLSGYDNYAMLDDVAMNNSVSLVIEIDELLDSGYSKEQIIKLIDNANFSKVLKISNEEAEEFREYAYYLLDIRYNLYLEEKKELKTKKYLFNK